MLISKGILSRENVDHQLQSGRRHRHPANSKTSLPVRRTNPQKFPLAINYSGLCRSAGAETVDALVAFLRQHLPLKWTELYSAMASHPVNVVKVNRGTYQYLYDFHSGLEALGEVSFDQRIRDRVIGVLGTSAPTRGPRRGSLQNGCLDLPEELPSSPRDKGHFIAHSIGGGLDINVFFQDRDLNRGVSHAGKLYREMERYCHSNPGTFCFSRPVYAGTTSVPQWLEFGLIKKDGTLWVETFEN
ncbi:MAG TPA: hypothetical protein VFU86_18245 [Terriglobales bacterium]|nr:hypothetical protein [Terriglobales bacterium]